MTDLFQGDQPVETESLIGEGKRYQTTGDAEKALIEKDRFIEQLKREASEAREALSKRMNEESFLDRLETLHRPQSPESPPQEPRRDEVTPAVTPEQIRQMIKEEDVAKKRQANLSSVEAKLKEVYGDEWQAKVRDQAKSLDLGTEYLTSVAAQSPAAFYSVMGMTQQAPQPSMAPPQSVMRTPGAPAVTSRDYTYWAQQRKEKGDTWYFSIPVQQEIWREVKSQGETKFYSRS